MIERVLELLGKGFCGITPGLKLNSPMGLRKPCLMLEVSQELPRIGQGSPDRGKEGGTVAR
jgi:hypothetical protein